MSQDEGRIKYHYGFYAAMKVEYDLLQADVEYEQEFQLGEEPIRLDFLIIKKKPQVVLTDPIGEYFEAVNIFEYKSPEDGLSIDDFYKAVAYAFIYKGYGRKVDELPIKDMTLTLVRHSYPRELMKDLEKYGFTVEEQHNGVYHIGGITGLKIQIIAPSRLSQGEYEGLHLLAKGCTEDAVVHYSRKTAASDNGNVKTNAETVIKTCLKINKDLDLQLKEDKVMDINKAITGIFNAVEEEGIKKGKQEGINEANERFATDMLRNGEPLDKILRYSRLAEDTIRSLAASLGLQVI